MASNVKEILDDLRTKFNSIDATRRRMDKLYLEGRIYRKDLEHVYEGIFLKAVTTFEYSIESIFLGSLYGKYRFNSRKRIHKIQFDDKKIATDIVFGGQNYVDWMPFDKTLKRSKIFFTDQNPFRILDANEKNFIEQISIIRNAIAHRSGYSANLFRLRIVDGIIGLPDANKSPAGFLRYVYRTGPDQTKFENYLLEITNIVSKISSFT